MSTTQRIQWIDACKGIGIFLVIIGHTMIDSHLRGEIYAFHMPLFFLISGYLFSIKKYQRFSEFFVAKVKSLLIPYIFFALISIVLLRVLLYEPININQFLKSLIFSGRNHIYFDEPLWFLTSLFTMEIIYYFLAKYIKNHYFKLMIVFISSFFAVSSLDALSGANILPWSFDQTLYYILYFGIGQFIKNIGWLSNKLKSSYTLIISSFVYISLLLFPEIYSNVMGFLNGTLHLPSNLTTFIVTVSWAIFAILFVIYLSQYLYVVPLLNYIGKNSLILLGLHISLGFNLINKVVIGKLHLKIDNPNLLGLVFTLGTIALLIPITFLINKYFPFILGKKYTSKQMQKKVSIRNVS